MGEPVVPIILNEREQLLEENVISDIFCEDPLTIENTIKNGTATGISTINITDDDSTTEEDEPVSPPTTNNIRRKSVTFSDEKHFIGVAATEKKKDKKNKKKCSASITNISSGYNNFKSHPYTNHPLVKFKKLKMKHTRRLPPAPENDAFLQDLRDKLMANCTEQK